MSSPTGSTPGPSSSTESSANGASSSRSGPILTALQSFFDESGWPVDVIDDPRPALQSEFEGEDDTWMCYAVPLEEARQALFYSVYPEGIPNARRTASAEYLTRVNFDLPVGNFELSFETGEVRVKTSIDVADDSISIALVRNLITANVVVMNRYLPGLRRVAFDNVAPDRALAKADA